MKFLVVDDEPVFKDMIVKLLTNDENEVVTAGSTQEAIGVLDQNSFDVLITDIVMPPGEDGTSLMMHVKRSYPDMAIIAMTAGLENAVEDYVNRAEMFADYALAKPFKPSDLMHVISKISK